MNTPLLELENVSVIRDPSLILDKINLRIPRYQHTAIIGPNGSGKSSLLKLLLRNFYPSLDAEGQQGKVRILGQRLWDVFELRRKMGVVTATLDHRFHAGRSGRMTVRETVASGFTATELKEFGPQSSAELDASVDHAVELVGLTAFSDRQLETLSTGERRRAIIARAMVHRPEIFVLDEPTSGLDLLARHRLLRMIADLMDQSSMTVLLVTHHIEEVPPSMQQVILLDQGKIVFDGPKQEGLTSQRLSDLFDTPIEVRQESDGWFRAALPPVSTVEKPNV